HGSLARRPLRTARLARRCPLPADRRRREDHLVPVVGRRARFRGRAQVGLPFPVYVRVGTLTACEPQLRPSACRADSSKSSMPAPPQGSTVLRSWTPTSLPPTNRQKRFARSASGWA